MSAGDGTASAPSASTSRCPEDIPLPPSPAPQKPTKRKHKAKQKEAAAKATEEPSHTSNWSWTSLTDSLASRIPPIFTKDGAYFFSVVGSSVKIYSTITGHVVSILSSPKPSTLEHEAPSSTITSAILSPHNEFQLITGSSDGCIRVWDFLDVVLLQTIDIAQPVVHICAHEKFTDTIFVAAQRPTKKKSTKGKETEHNAIVLSISLKPFSGTIIANVQKPSRVLAVGKTRFPAGLAVSPNGAWLTAIAGHKAYVASTSDLKAGFTKYVSPETLTCLAFHPMDEYFATGDDKGCIRLWYCLNDQSAASAAVGVEKRAQSTTLHWHAHAVSSISFTPNGAYLLSGGEEAVLVIWQLHNSGKKEFIPRVGSPIKSIVVSQASEGRAEEYLLSLADATFVFVNSGSLRISRAYSRIKIDPSVSYAQPSSSTFTPLAVHPASSTLILPSSHPSSLQIYSPSTSRLVAELEVSPSNRVSRRDEAPLEPSRVEAVSISPSGEWMATVDSRPGDEAFRAEIHVKIWQWDYKSSFWILNTRIDRPHGLDRIHAIAFSPGRDNASLSMATTGNDKNIRTWRIRTNKNKNGSSEVFWTARSTFSCRSETPSCVSWSSDGSLMAVAFDSFVALYNPITNILLHTITLTECPKPTSVHFIGRRSRYIAVAGDQDVIFWDLIATSVRSHYRASWSIWKIIPHPLDDAFAVVYNHKPASINSSRQSTVQLFHHLHKDPYEEHALSIGFRDLLWYQLAPHNGSRIPFFRLVGITDSWSVVVAGHNVDLPAEDGSQAKVISDDTGRERPHTLFQDIFGKSAFEDVHNVTLPAKSKTSVARAPSKAGTSPSSIFDGPAYLMPPLESLFDSLMNNFLKPRGQEKEGDDLDAREQDLREEESKMDVDTNTEPILVSQQQRRTVDVEEMDALTKLFSVYAIQPNSKAAHTGMVQKPSVKSRTKTKPNGTEHGARKHDAADKFLSNPEADTLSKMNGISRHPPPYGKVSELEHSLPSLNQDLNQELESAAEPTSSPDVNGKNKKRKKAPS